MIGFYNQREEYLTIVDNHHILCVSSVKDGERGEGVTLE
jgi:hypothetical protein